MGSLAMNLVPIIANSPPVVPQRAPLSEAFVRRMIRVEVAAATSKLEARLDAALLENKLMTMFTVDILNMRRMTERPVQGDLIMASCIDLRDRDTVYSTRAIELLAHPRMFEFITSNIIRVLPDVNPFRCFFSSIFPTKPKQFIVFWQTGASGSIGFIYSCNSYKCGQLVLHDGQQLEKRESLTIDGTEHIALCFKTAKLISAITEQVYIPPACFCMGAAMQNQTDILTELRLFDQQIRGFIVVEF